MKKNKIRKIRKRGSGDTIGTVSISPFWLGVVVIAMVIAASNLGIVVDYYNAYKFNNF